MRAWSAPVLRRVVRGASNLTGSRRTPAAGSRNFCRCALEKIGAPGRTRTSTGVSPPDFESGLVTFPIIPHFAIRFRIACGTAVLVRRSYLVVPGNGYEVVPGWFLKEARSGAAHHKTVR